MGRCQCKNTVNKIKTSITPSEPSGATSARPEHPKAEEAEEIDLKNDFKKMTEAFKDEMKTMFKEFEEKTNKKLEGINKSLKESKEKAIKQVNKEVQDLKTEIEAIKKTPQTEGRLEMENLSKQTGTTDASITNKLQEVEERISGIEDTIEEIDLSVKGNTKTKKVITQNVQQIWDTMKRSNLRIIGIEKGEEYQLKGTENIFNKIIEENFPNLKKEMLMKVQEAYRTPIDWTSQKDPLLHNNQTTKHTE
ncbi:hypothetical protein STEG23_028022 [Scotinomys teguina]